GWPTSWRSITRPSTAAGSTSPRSSSACSAVNASIAVCPTPPPSCARSLRGRSDATPPPAPWTGASPPPTHASSSNACTPHFRSNRVLGLQRHLIVGLLISTKEGSGEDGFDRVHSSLAANRDFTGCFSVVSPQYYSSRIPRPVMPGNGRELPRQE